MRLVLMTALLTGLTLSAQSDKKAGGATATLRGCVDQAPNGNFILTGNVELKKIVTLHGETFQDESFAKHLGHTVRVTGRLTNEGEERVMRVRRIEHVSEFCAPAEPRK
jgi:hypothetical protein